VSPRTHSAQHLGPVEVPRGGTRLNGAARGQGKDLNRTLIFGNLIAYMYATLQSEGASRWACPSSRCWGILVADLAPHHGQTAKCQPNPGNAARPNCGRVMTWNAALDKWEPAFELNSQASSTIRLGHASVRSSSRLESGSGSAIFGDP
jgi:hypothetical protein